jgi:hypothetical protein
MRTIKTGIFLLTLAVVGQAEAGIKEWTAAKYEQAKTMLAKSKMSKEVLLIGGLGGTAFGLAVYALVSRIKDTPMKVKEAAVVACAPILAGIVIVVSDFLNKPMVSEQDQEADAKTKI